MMVNERIARRRREVREQQRRHRLRRTVGVVVVLASLAVLLLVERSPLVAISEIRVVGTQVLHPDEVRDAAGLTLGTSLLRLPLEEATRRVEALPRVDDAQLVRVDPLTIEIRVTEREPVLVARSGDASVLVDDDGMVVGPGPGPGLVVVDVVAGGLPQPGESVLSTPVLANATGVAQALPGPIRTRIASYRAVQDDRVVLVLDDGTEVEFGRAADVAAKARSLAAVLEDLGDRVVTTIDVRAPSAPVVTP